MKTTYRYPILFILCFWMSFNSAQTKTTLLYNGPTADKFDIVFMGDGFTSAQQTDFNNLVANYFKAMFTYENGSLDNVLAELQDALNVYRVNVNSADSDVTVYTCGENANCVNQTAVNRNTAFNMRYSGCWDCCWMAKSANTDSKINSALSAVGLAGAEYVVMILNHTGSGGCSYGSVLSVTRSTSNNVLFHELGHSVGGLADEYDKTGCYSGSEPSPRNVSTITATDKWKLFARNPITTGNPPEYNVSQTGAFEGARYKDQCIYRPSNNSTMRGNTNLHNPPSYDEFWVRNKPNSNYNFNKVYVGNFGGSNYSDVLIHYGNHIAAYLVGTPPDGFTGDGIGTRVMSSYITTKKIKGPGGTWNVSSSDKFYPGDFSGDGLDDLIAFYPNGANSRLALLKSIPGGFECVKKYYNNLPGWEMRNGDQFYVADFNADSKKDIYVVNTANWSMGYCGMLKSNGSALEFTRRYDQYIPGNYLTSSDKFYIADLNGDGKEEFVLFKSNTQTTRLYQSSGSSLSIEAEYFGSLPGWTSKANDQYFIADFNNDNKDDLYVFNGVNWGPEYMLMLKSNGTNYDYVIRYDDHLPNWNMNNNDKYYVADINGDGKEDLYVFNTNDWATQWLGTVISSGTGLNVATKQGDWIGGWNLGGVDKLTVDKRSSGREHLFISNSNWFGYLWSGSSGLYQKAMYYSYIHAFKHHDYGWY